MSLVITQNLVLGSKDCPLIRPYYSRIGWNNKTIGITASSEMVDFEADNALTQSTYDYWIPSSMPAIAEITLSGSVSFIGISASTIADNNVAVKAEYFDGVDYQLIGEVLPADNRAVIFIFDEVSASKVRLTFTGSNAPQIGVIQAGDILTIPANLESGFVDLFLNKNVVMDNNISENGHVLGRKVVRTSLTGSAEWKMTEYDWVAKYYLPFMDYAEINAYWFVPNPQLSPDRSYYCWSNESLSRGIGNRNRQFLPITINMEAYLG